MASSTFEGRLGPNPPVFQEGETVLIFQGSKMRKAQCIWVTVEKEQIKYLVCYPSGSEISSARRGATVYPSAPLWRPPSAPTGPTPSGPWLWPSHSSSGSCCSKPMVLGRGDSRILDPLPVAPMLFFKKPLYPLVPHGWEYDWVLEGSVLRYSAAYMQRDRHAYLLLQIAAERKQQREHPHTSSWGSDHCNPGEGSTAGGTMVQPNPEIGRMRVQGRGSEPSKDRDVTPDPEKESMGRQEIQIHLPKVLRSLLVQDWELVTLEKKLVTIPARKTVDAILTEYATFQSNNQSIDKKCAISGLVSLIKEYFDMVLATQLLHKFERPQYAEILARYPNCQMSQLYGGAHLIRLFPQMASILTSTSLNESSLNVLLSHLQDFLAYLARDPSQLSVAATDYQLATEEYQKKAE
ncbi:mortality factor 4-like protein 2 [Dromiciops gliroides]|uniref:mortality factor 4-like protein 2 n=1 Tax=Dromiciops gliroides TaxID=33562 RepID=UPI001CC5C129|nr:mortality factor 4-like protein 2 [Dromiciops gliroides]